MSDPALRTLLSEMRQMRGALDEMRGEVEMIHQKIDGLSVLLTLLAGATGGTDPDDAFDALMDDLGDDNPQ